MAKRAPRTVLEACVAKQGVHKGAFTAAWTGQYALATVELGHVPSNREYAEYWAMDERNGWDHRARIKDVFGEKWPEVVQYLADEIERRKTRSLAKVRAIPLPAR
jgi:hypothetical protein